MVGDTVHVWDGAAGMTDGDYVIQAGGIDDAGNRILINLEENDADCRVYGVTLATRICPNICVLLENCEANVVDTMRVVNFRTAFVQLDSECRDCEVRNVREWRGYARESDNYWMTYARPANGLIDNSGRGTFVGAKNMYDNAATLDYNGRFDWDGVQVDSATVLNVAAAWGPLYKVYVTGTTQVDELDGGYVGQMVTLIGTNAAGFTIDDDDGRDAGGAIDLIGVNDDATLQAGEPILLMCIVDTAAAQIWVEPGNW